MSLLKVEFAELYRRHLCRHSQFGINVLHLLSVAGVYISLFAIAFALPGSMWIIGGVLTTYFLLLAFNLPPLLLLANALFVGLLAAIYLALPPVSMWIYVVLLIFWHRFQVWNHKIYDHSRDMSEFNGKYKKGPKLFVLLAIYELPILLNYLVFDRRSDRNDQPESVASGDDVQPT
jgi:hypothetical protein